MKLYIFSIGGSGTRIIKSLVHLLASGSKVPQDAEIVPIIIDTDAQSWESDHLKSLIAQYNQVQEVFFQNQDDNRKESKFFNAKISSQQFNFESINLSSTFNDFLNRYPGQPKELSSNHKLLLDSLYDNSPENTPNTELNLNLNVGFKGNPNIGGIVFNMLDDDENFRNLLKGIKGEDRIFIVSSIFGGNGSSGFPAIMNLIHNSPEQNLQAAKKGALTVLPYYDVLTPDDGGAINGKLFNSKSKSALSFYINDPVLNSLNAHYYLADGKRGQYAYSEGGTSQQNQASFIEFVGALMMLDFFNKPNFVDEEKKFAFALEMLGTDLGDNVIHLGHFKKEKNLYETVLKNLIEFAFGRKYFLELKGNQAEVGAFDRESDFFSRQNDCYRVVLDNYYAEWDNWHAELEDTRTGKRGLKFFELNRGLGALINMAPSFKTEFADYTYSLITNFQGTNSSHKPFKFISALQIISNELSKKSQYPQLQ